MTKYAFVNASNVVVNVIAGALTPQQQTQFLRDYGILFGAVAIIEVAQDAGVWIGGLYADGVFNPPAPEAQPEPLPEPQPEPVI